MAVGRPPGKEDERYSYPYKPPASLLRAIPPAAAAAAEPSVVTVQYSEVRSPSGSGRDRRVLPVSSAGGMKGDGRCRS